MLLLHHLGGDTGARPRVPEGPLLGGCGADTSLHKASLVQGWPAGGFRPTPAVQG